MTIDIDMESLTRTFLAEAEENLATMESGLLALEARPNDAEALHTVFRMAHSIKGDARCVGFTTVADFAHVMEDVLDRMRAGGLSAGPVVISVLLSAVDRLRHLVSCAAAGTHELETEDADLLDSLRALLESEDPRAAATTVDAAYASTSASAEKRPARTLRVDSARLDQMLDLTGEIAIARGRLRQILESIPADSGAAALESFHDAERMFLDLQELVMRVRMVPVGTVFRQQARVVRDLATAEGKSASLVVEGADAEIDNTLLEQIRQPLTHMLRNALHHGIETPEERRAAGKDPVGRVTLRAFQEAGTIVLEVSDDGRGVDREALLRRAIQAGVVAEGNRLEDREILDLVFQPGISTAAEVTDISGRGVGMDVVRRNVDQLHGSVHLSSAAGTGTTVTVRLPLTLAIIEGFGVSVAGERYIVPQEYIVECIELPPGTRSVRGTGVISVRDRALPFVRLSRLFNLEEAPGARANVVVVEANGLRAGLAVDVLHGQIQVVIKPLSKLFRSLPMVAGSAILGDGRVALILDVPSLINNVLEIERAA